MILPIKIQTSFENSINYPENLRGTGITVYRSTLAAYKKRFDDVETRLCLVKDKDIQTKFEVPFRDFVAANGEDPAKRNIHSQDGLTQWLGISTTVDPMTPGKLQVVANKRDPKCRFVQVHDLLQSQGRSSFSPDTFLRHTIVSD
jgi:hypothetical protein